MHCLDFAPAVFFCTSWAAAPRQTPDQFDGMVAFIKNPFLISWTAQVFCQSAIESAQNDHAMVVQSMIDNKTAHLTKIKALFSEIGAEESGVLTIGVFEEKIKTPAVRQYFEALGLDVWDAWLGSRRDRIEDAFQISAPSLNPGPVAPLISDFARPRTDG